MTRGLTRFQHSRQSHFVTFCCYHCRLLFTTDTSRRIFESFLERVRRSFGLQVYGYVVMAEHVRGELGNPSTAPELRYACSGWLRMTEGAFLPDREIRFFSRVHSATRVTAHRSHRCRRKACRVSLGLDGRGARPYMGSAWHYISHAGVESP